MNRANGRQPVTVLVIEDERDINQLLTGHLRRLGYQVASAQTGEHGVALAVRERPDVVLVDVMLPGIDGREVIRRLRADDRTAGCAVVVCSVLEPVDLVELGADTLLPKPFSRAEVAEVLGRVTNGGSA